MTSSSDRCPCLELKLEHCLCRTAGLLLLCGVADAPAFAVPQNIHQRSRWRCLRMHAVAHAQLEGHPAPRWHHPPFELAGGFPLPVKAQLRRTCSWVTARTPPGLLRRSVRQEEKKQRSRAELIAR